MGLDLSKWLLVLQNKKLGRGRIAPALPWRYEWPQEIDDEEKLEFILALWDMWDLDAAAEADDGTIDDEEGSGYPATGESYSVDAEDSLGCYAVGPERVSEEEWHRPTFADENGRWSPGPDNDTGCGARWDDTPTTDIDDSRSDDEDEMEEMEEMEDDAQAWRQLVTGSIFLARGRQVGLTVV